MKYSNGTIIKLSADDATSIGENIIAEAKKNKENLEEMNLAAIDLYNFDKKSAN